MNILVVSQHFWPETFRINEVVESLIEAGCEVTVLTGQPNYPDGKIFHGYHAFGAGIQRHASGYTICRVPIFPRGRGGTLRLVANYLSFVVSATLIGIFLLRRKKFDTIFVYAVSPILQAIPALAIRFFKRAALVIWVQDLWPRSLEVTGFVSNRVILRAVGAITSWIYRRSDLLLVPSRGFEEVIRPAAGDIEIVFHPNPAEKAVGLNIWEKPCMFQMPAGFSIVFAGNLGTAQALETVIEAADMLSDESDIIFVLIGSGSIQSALVAEVGRRGLKNVRFTGRYPADAMPGIYAQASALLVSLVHDPLLAQIIPSKVPTYLAAGRPILAALEGEGAEVVRQSGSGFVVPPQDARSLASAIRVLKQMPEAERDAMGRAGRSYFRENFDPDRLTNDLIAHFEHAIAAR